MGRGRIVGILLGLVALLTVAVGVGWSAHTVFAPPAPLATAAYTTATVSEATVSDTLDLSATAAWRQSVIASNAAVGVVTSVDVAPGDRVSSGAVLYTVDLRPVAAAVGDVPMFRPIAPGTAGDDVAQLQRMLASTGHYTGAVDGKVEALTAKAIVAWQKSLGIEPDGVVQAQDVVFVPRLPARLALDPALVSTGLSVVGGERAVALLDDAPTFQLSATPQEARTVPEGAAVEVTAPDGTPWHAVAGARSADDENGIVRIALATAEGGPPCAAACETIPLGADTVLPAVVVLQAETSGPAVPTSALQTTGDGEVFVVDRRGTEHPVTVVGSSDGLSVVDGVEVGMTVRLPTGSSGRGDE